jgi:hypothetical protein
MNLHRTLAVLAAGTAALALLAAPVAAGTIAAGIDVWNTPDDGNTYVDFTQNPIPAGYFCTGAGAYAQQIPVKGSPIVTNPANALGSSDTIVQRTTDATFSGLTATTTIQVAAVNLIQHAPITVNCGSAGNQTFNVAVNLNPSPPAGTQTQTSMSITESDSTGAGGTFSATVVVPALVTFTNTSTGAKLTPVSDVVTLQVSNGSWAATPGTGGVTYSNSLLIDSTGSGTASTSVPGTSSNFAAGWSKSCSPSCPVKISHQGPHPTWPQPPPPPCNGNTAEAVLKALRADAARRPGTTLDAAGAPAIASVTKYAGGTVVALNHGFSAAQLGAKPNASQPIKICYINSPVYNGDVIIVGTADGSPVRDSR